MKERKELVIVGAGSWGRVTHDFLIADECKVVGFVDDFKKEIIGVKGIPIYRTDNVETLIKENRQFIMAVYDGRSRELMAAALKDKGAKFCGYISGDASIAPTVNIGDESIVLPNTYLMNSASIGACCHIHLLTTIGHDVVLGPYSSLMTHCAIGGGCEIGTGVMFGMGAVVVPYKRIGDYSIIGAGALVTNHVPPNSIVYGRQGKVMPRRSIKK